jgi:hypothetical protein
MFLPIIGLLYKFRFCKHSISYSELKVKHVLSSLRIIINNLLANLRHTIEFKYVTMSRAFKLDNKLHVPLLWPNL